MHNYKYIHLVGIFQNIFNVYIGTCIYLSASINIFHYYYCYNLYFIWLYIKTVCMYILNNIISCVYACGCNLAVFVIYTGIYLINFMDSHIILELGRILENIWFFFYPTNIKTFMCRLHIMVSRGHHSHNGLCELHHLWFTFKAQSAVHLFATLWFLVIK